MGFMILIFFDKQEVMMKSLIVTALAVAKHYPVFPTNGSKLPCWSNKELNLPKGEGGFKIATQDPDRVVELFSHPKAKQVSVPMGPMSGLLAIDPDLYKGQHVVDWHAKNLHWLEKTLCHKTQRGGLHYIFKWTDKVRFPATLADGVDVKGHGGYVVWPGSGGYERANNNSIKAFPLNVLQAAMIAKGGSGNVLQMDGFNSATDDELIEQIKNATELYPALRSLSYRMPGRRNNDGTYLTETEMINILENVMDCSVASSSTHPRHDDWLDRRRKISELVSTAAEKERGGGGGLTPTELSAMQQGESFIETQEMIARSSRPIGPQRETTISDIEERVGVMLTAKVVEPNESEDIKRTGDFASRTVGQLVSTVLPPIKWVVPRMIPVGGTVSLAGMSNVGKTRWLAALVVGLAVGNTKRLGLPQTPRKITTVWIANEERTEDIWRRVKACARQHGDKDSAPIVVRGKGAGMLRLVAMNEAGNLEIDEKNVAIVVAEIRKAEAKLVIFDPYVTLSDAADENSANSASMITKAFLLITEATGAALVHAHHTPKDRNKDVDWVRGDASAWRGSGAIYSALDCGFTLANWMPKNTEQKRAWKQQYLTEKLSRFIVLDTGKIREGEALDPVMMELVPQDMAEGEGDPIGVCKLTDEATAANALLDGSVKATGNRLLADSMIEILGVGSYSNMTEVHRIMSGTPLWPDTSKSEGKDKLLDMFEVPFNATGGRVQVIHVSQRQWRIVIDKAE